MGKVNLPYVERTRVKGREYFYYRRDGQRIRLPGTPGAPEFNNRYHEVHESFERQSTDAKGKAAPGSMAALVIAYKESPEFSQLATKTQTDYRRYLDRISDHLGKLPAARMERRHVLAYRDRFAETPRTANYVVQILRLVLGWGVDRGWLKANPAQRPRQLKTGDGHRPWEEHEIAAFRKAWAANTVQRIAFEILLNTGQRGGDVVGMARHQAARGEIAVAQEKTGERVWIPQADQLRAIIGPWLEINKHMVILTTETGRPFKIDHFRHTMRDAIRTAALPDDCTLHGLRYTAATILRELGCDLPTIQAITGHRTAEMARKYSEKRRRAKVAIARLNRARRGAEKEAPERTEEDQ